MLDYKDMFQRANDEGRMAIIGYLPVGFPDPDTFIKAVEISSAAGMDILEVGMPAENPKFDGQLIREAQEKIRRLGIGIDQALELGAFAVCKAGCAGLAMMYGEDLVKYGVEKMIDRCAVLDMKGILSVAMEVENWKEIAQLSRTANIKAVPLITPDMDDLTIDDILQYAGGYLYVVSRKGPSGGHAEFDAQIEERITNVKRLAEGYGLPIAIGFGIRTPEDVTRLRNSGADAIIVGTALIEATIKGEGAIQDFVSALRCAARF